MQQNNQYQPNNQNRPQQNAPQNSYGQNNAPQNNSQGGNQASQPLDKGYIKVVREYIEKKVNGQVVYIQGTNQPQMIPLYKVIGEVSRWAKNNGPGFFDKIKMYPGNTILESLTEGTIDWQSQRAATNQGGY